MMIMEISLGQFMSRGGVQVWNITPMLKGIGYACLVMIVWINVYYIIILAWTAFYFFQAISGNSPWTTCGNDWNSECCSNEYHNGSLIVPENCLTEKPHFPEQEYWYNRVLGLTSGIEDIGPVRLELVGCLSLMWIVTYACIFRGAKSTGKAAYFTGSFPLVMLIILVIRGVTLTGAGDGIMYFIKPDFSKLRNPEVWVQAGSQVLFSYLSGQGVLTSLGSFNKFSFNVPKWTALICSLNFFASMMAGIAIFSVLGHMAHEIGTTVDKVAAGGPGLAFIAYPRALAKLPFPVMWYILFFGMILLLGIASQSAEVEAMCTMLVDFRPEFFSRNKFRRPIFVLLCCVLCFFLAIPMTTSGGMYLFQLCDSYGASGICLLSVVLFQAIAISWIYGKNRFIEDLHNMYGRKINVQGFPMNIFGFIWKWACPAVIMATLAYCCAKWQPPTYQRLDGTYNYPAAGTAVAIFMTLSSILAIPIYFVYLFMTTRRSLPRAPVKKILTEMREPLYPSDHPYIQSRRSTSSRSSRSDEELKKLQLE